MYAYGRRGLFENKIPQNIETPQNWFLGVFNSAEFGIEKFLRCIIEGPRVDFQ